MEEHGPSLFQAYGHDTERVGWRYLNNRPFADYPAFCIWLEQCRADKSIRFFAIEDKHQHKATGIASYLRIKLESGSIEVGNIHFAPALQRSTPATRAMYLMMRWIFDNGYRRYEWKCNALNMASRRAAQRLGFSYEGIFRQATISKGRSIDNAWFAIINKEWPALKQCFETWFDASNFDGTEQKVALSALTRPLLHQEDPESRR